MRVKLHRYKVKRKGICRSGAQAKKEYATISQRIRRLQVTIGELKREQDDRCVHSSKVRDERDSSCSKLGFLDSTINVRAMIAVLFLGVGGSDISKALSMMGLNDGLSFERNFSRNAPAIINNRLLDITATVKMRVKVETISRNKEMNNKQKHNSQLFYVILMNAGETCMLCPFEDRQRRTRMNVRRSRNRMARSSWLRVEFGNR